MKKNLLLSIFQLIILLLIFISCNSREDTPIVSLPSTPEVNNLSKFDFKGMKIIAHRTIWNGSPENSLISFENILNQNAHGVEFDIRMSADGVLVVFHNPAINGYDIAKTNSSVLLKQKINSNEYLPTFEDFVSTYKQLGNEHVRLYLDVKNIDNNDEYNRKMIKLILECMKKYEVSEDNIICFWDFKMLDYLREYSSPYKTAYISYSNGHIDKLIDKKIDYYSMFYESFQILSQEKKVKIKNANLKVALWTVDDIEKIKGFSNEGVDAVITDVPDELMEIYK